MEKDNVKPPVTAKGTEAFLAGSRVAGIGPAYARRLVEEFGTEAPRVILDDPSQAVRVKGLGASTVSEAARSIRSLKEPLELLIFLYSCGLSDMFIDRIVHKYRSRTEKVIETDPYSMVEDVWQLGFFTADKIGRALGIATDDTRRLQGALVGAVKHFAEEGHLFATPDEASARAAAMAEVDAEKIKAAVAPAVESGRLIESRGGLYLPVYYQAEKNGAAKITALAETVPAQVSSAEIPQMSLAGHRYSEAQRKGLEQIVNSPVSVLTGGPGTGKTTLLCGVIETLQNQGKRVVLAAPTGRAAKRMSALTGHDATTIHRLLGYRQGEGYHRRTIDADTLIIDEGSMLEQVLLNHLLDALRPGTQLIVTGDIDQLPAIGAGNVLRDMIDSGRIPVVRLVDNYRQSDTSLIAAAARSIRNGQMPQSDCARDFMFIEEKGTRAIHNKVLDLVASELPRAKGIDPRSILVVTPQQIGPLGARKLNTDLQERLNPEGPSLQRGTTTFRLGDPVMQTSNSAARGAYNGETGLITAVNPEGEQLEVTFSDGRRSTYSRSELKELTLAYATTVHKLQGSETKQMVLPLTLTHKPMLYRNLLYTAVSRATDLCVLVGEKEALRYAVNNLRTPNRNSNFKLRLRN